MGHWSLCGLHSLSSRLITLYRRYVTPLTTYPLVVWTEHSNKPLHKHKCTKDMMDPEAEVLAADAVAGAAPVVATAAGIAPANGAEDPSTLFSGLVAGPFSRPYDLYQCCRS